MIVSGVLFALFDLFVWALYITDDPVQEYCIPVNEGEPYDFLSGGTTPCLIDWMFLFREPFLLSVMIYAVIAGPAWIAFFVLRKKLSRS